MERLSSSIHYFWWEALKTIIAGSRSLGLTAVLQAVQRIDWPITEVVCGCAEGVDRAGWEWARRQDIAVAYFPAWEHQWKWADGVRRGDERIIYPLSGYGHGKGNGYARNAAMAEYADAALIVWDETSNGTANMRKIAEQRGLRVVVWNALEVGITSPT